MFSSGSQLNQMFLKHSGAHTAERLGRGLKIRGLIWQDGGGHWPEQRCRSGRDSKVSLRSSRALLEGRRGELGLTALEGQNAAQEGESTFIGGGAVSASVLLGKPPSICAC